MASRLSSMLALYAHGVLGVFLLFVPWTVVWDLAARGLAPPGIEAAITSGWARGAVSAVGALDLLVALKVALHVWGANEKKGGDEQRRPRSVSKE